MNVSYKDKNKATYAQLEFIKQLREQKNDTKEYHPNNITKVEASTYIKYLLNQKDCYVHEGIEGIDDGSD